MRVWQLVYKSGYYCLCWDCVVGFVWECSSLFTTKFINGMVYSLGRVKIPNLLNRFLHETLGVIPEIKQTNLFRKANIYLLLNGLPRKHSVLLHQVKISKMYWVDSASVVDVTHIFNCITCWTWESMYHTDLPNLGLYQLANKEL
jgi:hypothetical protein